jgi:hypothetical protein
MLMDSLAPAHAQALPRSANIVLQAKLCNQKCMHRCELHVETNQPQKLERCLHETDQHSHAPKILVGAEDIDEKWLSSLLMECLKLCGKAGVFNLKDDALAAKGLHKRRDTSCDLPSV